MSRSRRHHIVPQVLSKNFLQPNGKFFVFDQEHPRHGIEERTPRGTFWEKDANTIIRHDGETDTSVEAFFNTNVENPAAPTLRGIAESAEPFGFLNSENHRVLLTIFAYAQLKRSPSTRSLINDETYQELLEGARKEALEKLGREPTEQEKPLFEEKTDEILIRSASIKARTLSGRALDRLVRECGIAVAEAPTGASFLLGDEAVLRFGGELGTDGAELVLPISPQRSVIWCAKQYDGRHLLLDKAAVRYGNTNIWTKSRVVASPSIKLISSLRRNFRI